MIVHPLGHHGRGFRVSSPFGAARSTGPHQGIDLACPEGTNVYAVIGGTVYREYFAKDGHPNGNSVHIRGDGVLLSYLHLLISFVDVGDEVRPGQLIGLSGTTGRSTGPHLHFQVNADTEAKEVLDPAAVFPDLFR